MKHYILAIVLLFSLAAPAMAATNLTVNQISYGEMWINGTEFGSGATVTLSTSTIIPVTPAGEDYSYEITGMNLPAGSVLTLDASPVNNDLKLYVEKNWLIKKTFTDTVSALGIYFSYVTNTATVRCDKIPAYASGTLQTIRVYGTTTSSNVNLSVAVQQNVTADGSGNFSELVDISAIPAGVYTIHAIDDDTPPLSNTTNIAICAPGQLHHITITDSPTNNTLNIGDSYQFNATGYDLENAVVQNVAFVWWSASTYIGTIDYTGYFEAAHAGHTEVYARSGAKESNRVIVYVNAPMNNTTLTSEKNFTLESGNANVTGTFNRSVNGIATVKAVGNVTANTTVGLSAGYMFTSGAVVNVSGDAHDALEAGNCTVTIKLCVSDSELTAMGLSRSNVQMYVYNSSAGKWDGLTTTRVGTDCYIADISGYLSEATIGIGSKPTPSSGGGGGGGGGGTYPPGWFGTPTPTPTVTPTATPQPGVTPGGGVTPTPTKPAASGATQTASAKETPTKKKSAPGFPAVFAIAGMLAIAYMVLRQRR